MTIGVGGSTCEIELSKLSNMCLNSPFISKNEFTQRILKAQRLMKQSNLGAIYVNAGTNLYYFTGISWSSSERMVGAIIPAIGEIQYIMPTFEEGTFSTLIQLNGKLNLWEEHENPYELFVKVIRKLGLEATQIGLDGSSEFYIYDGINKTKPHLNMINATFIISECRSQKSDTEIAIMQLANNMTIEVHKAAARILYLGITTNEVIEFIHRAHKIVGATAGSAFCIVLFGQDTAFPHGVKTPKILEQDDVVLIDTGCKVEGYFSDITRCYIFGNPSETHRKVWQHEKMAQACAFAAAAIGIPCGDIDNAVRFYLKSEGYGPDYKLPGTPHRTGHGIGLNIHESPYLVKNENTLLSKGMCFSNEPMICIPGEFGIRHEDHFYMTDNGPKWFTQPAHSIDDPFGYNA